MLAIYDCCNSLPGCGTALCTEHISMVVYKINIPKCLYFITYFNGRLGTWLAQVVPMSVLTEMNTSRWFGFAIFPLFELEEIFWMEGKFQFRF